MADTSTTPAPARKRSKWPERLWIGVAALLIFASLWAFLARRYQQYYVREDVTKKIVLPLDEVDHIDAVAGALQDYNVVIITTDTTRADHIGCGSTPLSGGAWWLLGYSIFAWTALTQIEIWAVTPDMMVLAWLLIAGRLLVSIRDGRGGLGRHAARRYATWRSASSWAFW